MMQIDYSQLLEELREVARDAGREIMRIYESSIEVNFKDDGSPVTLADEAAENVILGKLKEIIPDIPIISEENSSSHQAEVTEQFFLIDPLDGTKEFLKKDGLGSFTVNIGLIENRIPTLGVVYAPALDRMFFASSATGAFEESKKGIQKITIRPVPNSGPIAVASVSHRDESTNNWLNRNHIKDTISIGSSLKFCLVACGEADVYPRFGPTMEWDTAAAHAIAKFSNCRMFESKSLNELQYNKKTLLNPFFIVEHV